MIDLNDCYSRVNRIIFINRLCQYYSTIDIHIDIRDILCDYAECIDNLSMVLNEEDIAFLSTGISMAASYVLWLVSIIVSICRLLTAKFSENTCYIFCCNLSVIHDHLIMNNQVKSLIVGYRSLYDCQSSASCWSICW